MELQGHVKRDPVTGSVGIRTFYQPTNPKLEQMLWLVLSTTQGVKYVGEAFIEGWDDLYIPEGS